MRAVVALASGDSAQMPAPDSSTTVALHLASAHQGAWPARRLTTTSDSSFSRNTQHLLVMPAAAVGEWLPGVTRGVLGSQT